MSLQLLTRTYIAPLRDLKRALVFIGTLLGTSSFGTVYFINSYSLADGPGIFAFFLMLFLAGDLIFAPLIYIGFRLKDGFAFRAALLLVQIAAFAFFITLQNAPLLQGLLTTLFSAPYWCAFHMGMVFRTTDENRGYEVAFTAFIWTVAAIGATSFSGLMLDHGLGDTARFAALIGLATGSCTILASIPFQARQRWGDYLSQSRAVLVQVPYLIRRNIGLGMMDITSFIMAGFLHLAGYNAVHVAALLVVRIALSFVATPLIGRLIHGQSPGGFAKGLLIIAAAWLFILLAPPSELAFGIFLLVLNIGLGIVSGSAHVGWYQLRSIPSMMWHGIFISTGRLLVLAPLIYLMQIDIRFYMAFIMMLALCIIAANSFWKKAYPHET